MRPTSSSLSVRSSPGLTVALVAGIVALLLLALWPFRSADPSPESAPVEPAEFSKETDPSARSLSPRAGVGDKPASESKVPDREKETATTPPSSRVPAPAGEPVALAESGAPLWPKPVPHAPGGGFSNVSPESEYQRQNRIWREGVESGRAHRKSGKIQTMTELEPIAEIYFPDDQTGQILFLLGYEWGSQVSAAPL